MNISKKAFSLDQYHSDCMLPQEVCNRYYEEWAKNSCEGFADEIVVLADNFSGNVIGYMSLHLKSTSAVVGLAAVSQSHQGKGCFSLMLDHVLYNLEKQGKDFLYYGTQLSNYPVLRVMAKFGGIPVQSNHVLHAMI